jgi:hypothetical protein
MDGACVGAPPVPVERAEIKLRQTSQKRHEHCQQARKPTVAVAERMNQDQFRVHFCEWN